MQACRCGHSKVVQTLLLVRCNITRADYLSGRIDLHFAAVNGHLRCIRLLVADFVPSTPFDAIDSPPNSDNTSPKNKFDQSALVKFINKSADGGITALHMAALNGLKMVSNINSLVSVIKMFLASTIS